MTALDPVPNVLKLSWQLTNSGVPAGGSRCFLHYTSGPPSNSDCASLLSAINTAWTTNIKPLQSTNIALATLNVRDLSTMTGGFAQSTPGTIGSRGAAGVMLIETCAVLNHVIQASYRGGKPRTYLTCGISSDLSVGNQWASGARTAFATGWLAFIAGIVASATPITIDHQASVAYYSGSTAHTNTAGTRGWTTPNRLHPPKTYTVTSTTCRLIVGTQRRRLTAGS